MTLPADFFHSHSAELGPHCCVYSHHLALSTTSGITEEGELGLFKKPNHVFV